MPSNEPMELKLETGIPIPPRNARTGGTTEFLRKMKAGDSFVCEASRRPAVASCARTIGVKVSMRKISDTEMRVWRIE